MTAESFTGGVQLKNILFQTESQSGAKSGLIKNFSVSSNTILLN